MKITRRLCAGIAASFSLLALSAPGALAQSPWPAKPIRFVVPFPAGGGTDIIARELGNRLSTGNGWTLVMDNRPGSGGNLGVDSVAKAAPETFVAEVLPFLIEVLEAICGRQEADGLRIGPRWSRFRDNSSSEVGDALFVGVEQALQPR